MNNRDYPQLSKHFCLAQLVGTIKVGSYTCTWYNNAMKFSTCHNSHFSAQIFHPNKRNKCDCLNIFYYKQLHVPINTYNIEYKVHVQMKHALYALCLWYKSAETREYVTVVILPYCYMHFKAMSFLSKVNILVQVRMCMFKFVWNNLHTIYGFCKNC